MFEVLTLNPAPHQVPVLESMFALRHAVFIERLQWTDLKSDNGLERDQFDNSDATYLCLRNDHGDVVASARMMPTHRPTLLTDIFPQLCDGAVPHDPDIWEVSRLVVDHRKDRVRAVSGCANVTGALLCALYEFGLAVGARHLVSVSDTRLERILMRAGWELNRLGAVIDPAGEAIVGEKALVTQEHLDRIRARNRITAPVINPESLPVVERIAA